MGTKNFIVDYLAKYGMKTFKEYPFNEVDFAICGALSYADYLESSVMVKFDSWKDKIPLSVFDSHETIKLLSRRYLSGPVVYYNFFKAVLKSERFKELRITKFMNKFDVKKNVQFCAMVYEFLDRKIIIYRGTDNSIAGWKEDCLTAVDDAVLAQDYALEYINRVLDSDKKTNYYIVGHSKGGNLAYFAFFNIKESQRKRILKCFNFDGNGFIHDVFDYRTYKDKIEKIVPSDDVVGAIFDTSRNHTVVQSSAFSVMAHDMLTWKINPHTWKSFLRAKDLTNNSKAFQISMNNWVRALSDEDLSDFIDFIFTLLDVNKPRTLKDLLISFNANKMKYLKSIEKYPEEKRRKLQFMSRDFLEDFAKAYVSLTPIKSIVPKTLLKPVKKDDKVVGEIELKPEEEKK